MTLGLSKTDQPKMRTPVVLLLDFGTEEEEGQILDQDKTECLVAATIIQPCPRSVMEDLRKSMKD